MTDKNRRRLEQIESVVCDEKVKVQITIEFMGRDGEVVRTIAAAVELSSQGRPVGGKL